MRVELISGGNAPKFNTVSLLSVGRDRGGNLGCHVKTMVAVVVNNCYLWAPLTHRYHCAVTDRLGCLAEQTRSAGSPRPGGAPVRCARIGGPPPGFPDFRSRTPCTICLDYSAVSNRATARFLGELPLANDTNWSYRARRTEMPIVHSRPTNVHSRPAAVRSLQLNVHLLFAYRFSSAAGWDHKCRVQSWAASPVR